MIYDCFTFYNEFDVLELRLRELYDVVDRFVLVEATKTHAGLAKPLFFEEHKAAFAPWLDKIVHIVVPDMPDDPNSWVLENFQRNAIMRGLPDLRGDDIVLVSDVDEIPRHSLVAEMPNSPAMLYGFRMPLFYFKFNYMNTVGAVREVWTVGARGVQLATMSPQGLRRARPALMNPEVLRANGNQIKIYEQAGWHFSYLGNTEHVRNKIASFAHQEFNKPDIMETIDVEAIVQRSDDIFGRAAFQWQAVELTEYFPAHILRNRERYSPFIIEGATAQPPALS